MATARQRQDYNNYSAKVSRTVQPKVVYECLQVVHLL